MTDLISRKAAIEWFFRPYSNEESYSNLDVERALKAIPAVDAVPVVMAGAELTDTELIEKIRKAPIALKPNVDAVPIIRCASCKWWNGSTLGAAHRCAALHIATTGEFYCAAAERKSNANPRRHRAEAGD